MLSDNFTLEENQPIKKLVLTFWNLELRTTWNAADFARRELIYIIHILSPAPSLDSTSLSSTMGCAASTVSHKKSQSKSPIVTKFLHTTKQKELIRHSWKLLQKRRTEIGVKVFLMWVCWFNLVITCRILVQFSVVLLLTVDCARAENSAAKFILNI